MCHSSSPRNATYAYAVLPGAGPSSAVSFPQQLTIGANNAAVQAVQVREVGSVVTSVVFWTAGA
jgi:hypothetical protein